MKQYYKYHLTENGDYRITFDEENRISEEEFNFVPGEGNSDISATIDVSSQVFPGNSDLTAIIYIDVSNQLLNGKIIVIQDGENDLQSQLTVDVNYQLLNGQIVIIKEGFKDLPITIDVKYSTTFSFTCKS